MPFGQKSAWFQLFAEAIIFVWFIWRFGERHAAGAFDGPDGLATLGLAMLWFVLAMVVLVIAVHILGLIVLAIAEGGREPDTTTDERDQVIELAGQKVAHGLSGTGFLIAMILLALGWSVPLAMAAIFLGGILGEIIGNVVKLRRYARG